MMSSSLRFSQRLDFRLSAASEEEMATMNMLVEGLGDDTLDCIATDHAPHSILEKEVEFDRAANGIIGLESQTAKSMELNFRAIAGFRPSHVSVYILEGVPRPTDDDRDARLQPLRRLRDAHRAPAPHDPPPRPVRRAGGGRARRIRPYLESAMEAKMPCPTGSRPMSCLTISWAA